MQNVIHNGVPWYDQNKNPVNAHAGCLIKAHDKFYLFGEYKTDEVNHFIGFSKYSSGDLSNWTFEGLALPLQSSGILGPNRIGERVKVLQVPNSNRMVMLMHTDDMHYTDPYIGIATTDDISKEFQFQGPLLFNGEPIRKWDMGTFIDNDGTGYLLTHEGNIYRLAADYQSVVEEVVTDIAPGGESPAMFRQGNYYFLLMSNKTSWERNDNYYLCATDIHGPWTNKGPFCPKGTLTYNSQCSFVFMLSGNGHTIPMYMGDRWSFPRQAASATQVWLPMTVDGSQLSIANYWENWDWQAIKETTFNADQMPLNFSSNKKGDTVTIDFEGTQILVRGRSEKAGGYAQFVLKNDHGEVIQDTTIDFYSLVSDEGQRYRSPKLSFGTYHLTVKVLAEESIWYDKRRHQYGSNDVFVSLTAYQVGNK